MRIVFWVLVIALAAVVAVFAIDNRALTTVEFAPLPYLIEMPLFLVILGSMFVGLLIGGVAAWLAQGRWRRKARELARRERQREAEMTALKARATAPAPAGAPRLGAS